MNAIFVLWFVDRDVGGCIARLAVVASVTASVSRRGLAPTATAADWRRAVCFGGLRVACCRRSAGWMIAYFAARGHAAR